MFIPSLGIGPSITSINQINVRLPMDMGSARNNLVSRPSVSVQVPVSRVHLAKGVRGQEMESGSGRYWNGREKDAIN